MSSKYKPQKPSQDPYGQRLRKLTTNRHRLTQSKAQEKRRIWEEKGGFRVDTLYLFIIV